MVMGIRRYIVLDSCGKRAAGQPKNGYACISDAYNFIGINGRTGSWKILKVK